MATAKGDKDSGDTPGTQQPPQLSGVSCGSAPFSRLDVSASHRSKKQPERYMSMCHLLTHFALSPLRLVPTEPGSERHTIVYMGVPVLDVDTRTGHVSYLAEKMPPLVVVMRQLLLDVFAGMNVAMCVALVECILNASQAHRTSAENVILAKRTVDLECRVDQLTNQVMCLAQTLDALRGQLQASASGTGARSAMPDDTSWAMFMDTDTFM